MNIIKKRIEMLRALMRERNIDAYMVPTADYHESEYVGEHFAFRKYITGFTGSAGTALITKDWAGLWTDGRYYVQAAAELEGSGIVLMKSGTSGVPTVEEFLEQDLPNYGTLGFDGRVVNAKMGENLEKRLAFKHISFAFTESLIGELWENRPKLSAEPVWILGDEYTGCPAAKKIAQLRKDMEREHATVHIMTTLDDIVWLLNIRGNDTPCNPVVLSYLAVTAEEIFLFVNRHVISEEVEAYLKGLGVTLRSYQDIYTYASHLKHEKVLLEKAKVNYTIVRSLDETNEIIDRMNPTVLKKACKNPVEVENLKKAHIIDGVVMTKFIYWMKQNIGKVPMTECSVADKLDQMRRDAGALDVSFTTISAYGANAAMCHYHAVPETCAALEPKGLYLVDSGGQYLEGTTDITRTFALGPVTEEEKEHYTLVLMGMLRLGNARFLEGCTGLSLDYIAREPLWKHGLDFNHGTGHGVGYLLNVHERPVNIRYKVTADRPDAYPFVPGMVCSDEPGLYIEGSHGIRTENLLVCQDYKANKFGHFLRFEFLTYVPIDLEPVKPELMSDQDIAYLNEYHEQVYEKIAPHLNKEEEEWLRKVTLPIKK
jgi:Xaa-Pro aminopeptidase